MLVDHYNHLQIVRAPVVGIQENGLVKKQFRRFELSKNTKLPRCIRCGGKVCICSDVGKWAAHCMDCDNNIGKEGYYDPCAVSKQVAEFMWIYQNSK